MSVLTGDNPFADLKEKKGPCWTGYRKVPGKKDYEDGSCVKAEETETEEDTVEEDKKGHFRSTESGAGMTSKGVKAYNAKTGGNLKTAVTGDAKPGSKAAGRRKSFCARSKGWNGERGKAARRRWKC